MKKFFAVALAITCFSFASQAKTKLTAASQPVTNVCNINKSVETKLAQIAFQITNNSFENAEGKGRSASCKANLYAVSNCTVKK